MLAQRLCNLHRGVEGSQKHWENIPWSSCLCICVSVLRLPLLHPAHSDEIRMYWFCRFHVLWLKGREKKKMKETEARRFAFQTIRMWTGLIEIRGAERSLRSKRCYRSWISRTGPCKRLPTPALLTINDLIFHLMQLAHNFIQNLLQGHKQARCTCEFTFTQTSSSGDSQYILQVKITCFILSNSVSASLVLPIGLTLKYTRNLLSTAYHHSNVVFRIFDFWPFRLLTWTPARTFPTSLTSPTAS